MQVRQRGLACSRAAGAAPCPRRQRGNRTMLLTNLVRAVFGYRTCGLKMFFDTYPLGLTFSAWCSDITVPAAIHA
eukprot:3615814-Pleurochrysis_carterae.AAC.3